MCVRVKAEVQRRYRCIQGVQQVDGRTRTEQAGNLQRVRRRAEQKAARVLAASVFLNGTAVAFSLYLEVWVKYIFFFNLKHCLASWRVAESVGRQPWGGMPGPSA